MAKIERVYNVPLRKGFYKAPRYRKAKKAVTTLKEFLVRHMKCGPDDVRLGRLLNMKIWENGVRHPPHHIKLTAVKDDDGIVKAELFGFKYEEPIKPEEKKEEKAKTETAGTEKAVEELKKEPDTAEKEEKPAKAAKEKPKRKPAAKKKTAKKEN